MGGLRHGGLIKHERRGKLSCKKSDASQRVIKEVVRTENAFQ